MCIFESSYPYLCGITHEMLWSPQVQQFHNYVIVDLDTGSVGYKS